MQFPQAFAVLKVTWRFLSASMAVLFVAANCVACINEYGTSLSGKSRLKKSHSEVPPPIDMSQHYRKQIATLTAQGTENANFKNISDLAVAYLYVGETARAIELLEQAEKLQPNEYVVAANLGTAYELAGRNEDALRWIEKGIRLNPDSHQGSEWVHVNVLRAKIAMASDSDWLSANSVTGLEFGDGRLPAFDPGASYDNCPQALSDIRTHLEYQLLERRKFIPGADPLVAALMFDLANATAVSRSVEDALPIYRAARELGYHDTALLNRRLLAMEDLRDHNWLSGWTYQSLGLGALCTIAALVVVLLVCRRVNRRKNPTNQGLHTEASA